VPFSRTGNRKPPDAISLIFSGYGGERERERERERGLTHFFKAKVMGNNSVEFSARNNILKMVQRLEARILDFTPNPIKKKTNPHDKQMSGMQFEMQS
jgi:hypothetical protein